MPPYKLTYFDGRGRAEVARLIFAYAGVAFEDVRLSREEWTKFKPSAPSNSIPYLEVDGKAYPQSNAFSRYLAIKYGLNGKTPEDGMRIDMIVDMIEDAIKPIFGMLSAKTEEDKAAIKKKFEEEQYPASLKYLEKVLNENKGGNGFFVGDDVTWADFAFFNWATWPDNDFFKAKVDLSRVPKLQAHVNRVAKHPKLEAYLKKRPETGF